MSENLSLLRQTVKDLDETVRDLSRRLSLIESEAKSQGKSPKLKQGLAVPSSNGINGIAAWDHGGISVRERDDQQDGLKARPTTAGVIPLHYQQYEHERLRPSSAPAPTSARPLRQLSTQSNLQIIGAKHSRRWEGSDDEENQHGIDKDTEEGNKVTVKRRKLRSSSGVPTGPIRETATILENGRSIGSERVGGKMLEGKTSHQRRHENGDSDDMALVEAVSVPKGEDIQFKFHLQPSLTSPGNRSDELKTLLNGIDPSHLSELLRPAIVRCMEDKENKSFFDVDRDRKDKRADARLRKLEIKVKLLTSGTADLTKWRRRVGFKQIAEQRRKPLPIPRLPSVSRLVQGHPSSAVDSRAVPSHSARQTRVQFPQSPSMYAGTEPTSQSSLLSSMHPRSENVAFSSRSHHQTQERSNPADTLAHRRNREVSPASTRMPHFPQGYHSALRSSSATPLQTTPSISGEHHSQSQVQERHQQPHIAASRRPSAYGSPVLSNHRAEDARYRVERFDSSSPHPSAGGSAHASYSEHGEKPVSLYPHPRSSYPLPRQVSLAGPSGSSHFAGSTARMDSSGHAITPVSRSPIGYYSGTHSAPGNRYASGYFDPSNRPSPSPSEDSSTQYSAHQPPAAEVKSKEDSHPATGGQKGEPVPEASSSSKKRRRGGQPKEDKDKDPALQFNPNRPLKIPRPRKDCGFEADLLYKQLVETLEACKSTWQMNPKARSILEDAFGNEDELVVPAFNFPVNGAGDKSEEEPDKSRVFQTAGKSSTFSIPLTGPNSIPEDHKERIQLFNRIDDLLEAIGEKLWAPEEYAKMFVLQVTRDVLLAVLTQYGIEPLIPQALLYRQSQATKQKNYPREHLESVFEFEDKPGNPRSRRYLMKSRAGRRAEEMVDLLGLNWVTSGGWEKMRSLLCHANNDIWKRFLELCIDATQDGTFHSIIAGSDFDPSGTHVPRPGIQELRWKDVGFTKYYVHATTKAESSGSSGEQRKHSEASGSGTAIIDKGKRTTAKRSDSLASTSTAARSRAKSSAQASPSTGSPVRPTNNVGRSQASDYMQHQEGPSQYGLIHQQSQPREYYQQQQRSFAYQTPGVSVTRESREGEGSVGARTSGEMYHYGQPSSSHPSSTTATMTNPRYHDHMNLPGNRRGGEGEKGGENEEDEDEDEDEEEDEEEDGEGEEDEDEDEEGTEAGDHELGYGNDVCICCGHGDGVMIGCENQHCRRPWYHLSCLRLPQIPQGTWFCPQCAAALDRHRQQQREWYDHQQERSLPVSASSSSRTGVPARSS